MGNAELCRLSLYACMQQEMGDVSYLTSTQTVFAVWAEVVGRESTMAERRECSHKRSLLAKF